MTAKRILAGAAFALAALCLSGCADFLQSMYDDAAHDDCDSVSSPSRQACHDNVDANARRHQN